MVNFCSNKEDFHRELLHNMHVTFSLLLHHCYWWYSISTCAGVEGDAVQDWQGCAVSQSLRISVSRLAQSGSEGLQKTASAVTLTSLLCNSRYCYQQLDEFTELLIGSLLVHFPSLIFHVFLFSGYRMPTHPVFFFFFFF